MCFFPDMFMSTGERVKAPPTKSVLSEASTRGDLKLAAWQKRVEGHGSSTPWFDGAKSAFTGRAEALGRMMGGEFPAFESMRAGMEAAREGTTFVATGGLDAYGVREAKDVGVAVAKDELSHLSPNPIRVLAGCRTAAGAGLMAATMSPEGVEELRGSA